MNDFFTLNLNIDIKHTMMEMKYSSTDQIITAAFRNFPR